MEDAILKTPKIVKNTIKRMCDKTKIYYLDNEKDIDLSVYDNFLIMALQASQTV